MIKYTMFNQIFQTALLVAILGSCQVFQAMMLPQVQAGQSPGLYYIRYDIKSYNNRIVDSSLLMVPADQDFRAEDFTTWEARGFIEAVPGDSARERLDRARENALKMLLEEKGLKSVSTASSFFSNKTAGADTVMSYEGAIIPPMEVVEQSYDPENKSFMALFKVRFSPISFPDQWKRLQLKRKVKHFFEDFISIF